MATFTLQIKCYWSKENGFESFVDDENTTDSGNADDEMDPENSGDDGDENMDDVAADEDDKSD